MPLLFLRERLLSTQCLPQGLERLVMQLLRFLHVPTLVREPTDKNLVCPIRQVHRRKKKQCFPVTALLHDQRGNRPGAAGDHETWGAPQELVVPYLPPAAARRQCNGAAD